MAMILGSDHASPITCSPTGSVSRTKPMGTVIAGKPVCGDRYWLLSPWGVPRSPISRGGFDSCPNAKVRAACSPSGKSLLSSGRF